jgi:hypothetical protein
MKTLLLAGAAIALLAGTTLSLAMAQANPPHRWDSSQPCLARRGKRRRTPSCHRLDTTQGRLDPEPDRRREGVSIVPASTRHMHPQGVAYRAILGEGSRAPLSLAYRSSETSAAVCNLAALPRHAAANVGRDMHAGSG